MEARDEFWKQIYNLCLDAAEAEKVEDEFKIKDQGLAMTYDRIKELEAKLKQAEHDAEFWEKLYGIAFPPL